MLQLVSMPPFQAYLCNLRVSIRHSSVFHFVVILFPKHAASGKDRNAEFFLLLGGSPIHYIA
jgi:hypothetical protein